MSSLTKIWNRVHATCLVKPKLTFITWMDKQLPGKYCWAECIRWAYDPYKFNPFKIMIAKPCEVYSCFENVSACECGQWVDGKCVGKMTETELEKLRAELEPVDSMVV